MKYKRFLQITAIASATAIGIAAGTASSGNMFLINKNLEIFSDIYKNLDLYYVDNLDHNQLFNDAITSMLADLDPYTNYISETDIESYRLETTGKYAGIGSIISKTETAIVFVEIMDGSPAYKAGIRPGDKLVSINKESVLKLSVEEISVRLKGQQGTTLQLEIQKPNLATNQILDLKRDEIEVDNVDFADLLEDNIVYVHLDQFTFNAAENIRKAIKHYSDSTKISGVILDLRNNPGGLLTEAVNICNLFLPKDKLIVYTKGKVDDWNNEWKTLNNPVYSDIPLTVLINGRSASASEIVSGALQDYDRAVILGERSYGKGLVQQTRDLPYNAKLKLTTAKYYIPSGRCIQKTDYYSFDTIQTITQFKTANGREVFDKGGVDPDVIQKDEQLAEITIDLLINRKIFDYAVEHAYSKKEVSIADFIQFLEKGKYSFESRHYSHLKEYIKKQENTTKQDSMLFQALEKAAAIEFKPLIQEFKTEILNEINSEVLRILETNKKVKQQRLKDDKLIVLAKQSILNTQKHQSILQKK